MKIAVRSTPSTSQKRSAEPSQSLIRLVAPTGITKKRPTASTSEKKIVRPQVKPPISSSSSPSASCLLAEMARALNPIFSDSARATTPRITGRRQTRLRFAQETIGSLVMSMRPSGVRHATAQIETPRIITPSRTAWPPTGASPTATGRPSGIRSDCAPPGRALFDCGSGSGLNAAACVNQLLLARIEGVALRADLHVKLGLRGARVEVVPARAVDVREDVFGMDIGLHLVQV